MKILLINPSQKESYGKLTPPDYPPLGLAYIASVLEKENHNVEILDFDADISTNEEFILKLKQNFDIIGITSTSPTFKNAEKICMLIKENSSSITLLGGIHATIAPDECLKSNNIDFLIRGEGEKTIAELIKALKNKTDINQVDGISYKKDGKIIHTKNRELISNLDEIPFPARHLFKHQKYSYPDSLKTPVMPILTSRGCPHNCTYCCTKQIFTRKMRFRSAVNVVNEIEHLIEKYKVKEIHIWDDNFTLNKNRVFEIRDELKRRNINLAFAFPNGLRVDQVDENILKALKDMGTYSLAFGVESGDQKILDLVKKGTTLEQIEKAYKLAKQIGLETWGFFMIGLPGETEETIKTTINFAKKINPDVAKFHILKPFPGTEAYSQLNEKGLIIETDHSKYGIHTKPVHRLETLSQDDLLHWSKTAYREFYLRPSKIINHIKRIKSWERFKLNLKTGMVLLKSL
ncbi:B12-binding domain-containing radical SAM protein [bacterium]|nr:B12-binding domain-containing radical SAM protein [bacterium]